MLRRAQSIWAVVKQSNCLTRVVYPKWLNWTPVPRNSTSSNSSQTLVAARLLTTFQIASDLIHNQSYSIYYRIYELRLMMDFNGNNRGFAFVKYCAQNDAKRALRELNNFEIRKGRLLGVCKSVDNCRYEGGNPLKSVCTINAFQSTSVQGHDYGQSLRRYQNHRNIEMQKELT